MSVSKRLRFEIFRRDNHTCRYCGQFAPAVPLTVDHVVPVALGGSDQADNLVAACIGCNAGKSSASPDAAHVADVAQDALRWAKAMQVAGQGQEVELQGLLDYIQEVDSIWVWYSSDGISPRPTDWRQSVETFYRYPVAPNEWIYAVDKAAGNRRVPRDDEWRYACGVIWARLRQRVDTASGILGGD